MNKILVVDDEVSVRDMLAEVLSDAGYEVEKAEDAIAALETLKDNDIFVIILDLRLFGMNGIELCRQIRKTRPLSIIFAITAWSTLFEVEECREAGFDDYFMKPIDLELLIASTEAAFKKLDRWQKPYKLL